MNALDDAAELSSASGTPAMVVIIISVVILDEEGWRRRRRRQLVIIDAAVNEEDALRLGSGVGRNDDDAAETEIDARVAGLQLCQRRRRRCRS